MSDSEVQEPLQSTTDVAEPERTSSPVVNEQPSTSLQSTSRSRGRSTSRSRTRTSRSYSAGATQRTSRSRSSSRGRTTRSRSRDRTGVTRNFIDPYDPTLEHTISKYQRSPGPVYDTGREKDLTLRHSQTVRIGTESREKFFARTSISPGPAYYRSGDYTDEHLSVHAKSPRATIGRYKPPSVLIRTHATEGPPISLPPLETYRTRSFRATIGKAPRTSSTGPQTPGPADYVRTEPHKVSSTRGTWTTATRGTGSWIFQ